VEVIAEGNRDLLEQLAGRLKEGPLAATVEDATLEWGESTGKYNDFEISPSR